MQPEFEPCLKICALCELINGQVRNLSCKVRSECPNSCGDLLRRTCYPNVSPQVPLVLFPKRLGREGTHDEEIEKEVLREFCRRSSGLVVANDGAGFPLFLILTTRGRAGKR